MTLIVNVPGNAQPLTFDDSVTSIPIGRDPDTCSKGVLISEDHTEVGREHCTIERVAGYYRLALNKHHAVLINGKLASDGQELGDEVDLQLGKAGPKLVVKTSLTSKVKPTSSKFEQKGSATRLKESEKVARRGRRIAVASVLLLGLATVVGFGLHNESTKKLKLHDEQIAAVEQHAAGLRRLEEALQASTRSVYLMGVQDPRGGWEVMATAWVVDRDNGLLATNGHVAAIFDEVQEKNKDETIAGYQFVARSTENPPRDFVIESVKIHPGYDQSAETFYKFNPQRRTSEIAIEEISMPGNYCDVAIMKVKDPTGLGLALELADPALLENLKGGDDVGLLGFPLENIDLGGVNETQPTPKVQIGHVVALTDYFDVAETDFDQRLLLEHSIPSTGGCSGSPIFNSEGRVVALLNAGNAFFKIGSYYRLPSAALINYGQRSDLVRELLDDHADEAQKKRTSQWEDELAKRYVRLDDANEQIKKGLADRKGRRNDTVIQPKIKDFATAGLSAMKWADDGATLENFTGMKVVDKYMLVRPESDGKVAFIAWIPYSEKFDKFDAYHATLNLEQDSSGAKVLSGSPKQGDKLATTHDENRGWFWYSQPADVKAGEVIACEISYTPETDADESASINAYFMPTPTTPPANIGDRRLELLDQWISSNLIWRFMNYQPVEVTHWSGTVGSSFAIDTANFPIATSDTYLFIVNSSNASAFSFDVSGRYGDGTTKVLGSNASVDGWATVQVYFGASLTSNSTTPPQWLETSLMNAAQGTKYEVYVYYPKSP